MRFVNWEGRPAVLADATPSAWAVLERGGAWVEVDRLEVIDSGSLVSEATFHSAFGALPPVPSEATKVRRRVRAPVTDKPPPMTS
jgi:hypothetical protein